MRDARLPPPPCPRFPGSRALFCCRRAGVIKPCLKRLLLHRVLCECAPLLALLGVLRSVWESFATFRWLCNWCPPFILRLRKEVTSEEEDADAEEGAAAQKGVDAVEEEP